MVSERGAQNVLVGILLALFVTLGWMGREGIQIASGDDITYLALSQSLEQGSYREIYRASEPLHVQYPPGYAAWLLVVRKVTGDRLEIIPAVNLALVTLSLLMVFGAARPLLGGWLATGMLVPLVLSPGVLWAGGSYYSEALFLFLTTAAVIAALRADQNEEDAARYSYITIALALLAFLTRAVGASLIVAVGLWLLSHRRKREFAVLALSAGLVVGGWFRYTSQPAQGVPVRTYGSDFLAGGTEAHPDVVGELVARVVSNAREYATEILPIELSMPTLEGTIADNAFWLLLNVALLATGILVLWRRWRLLALYLLMTAGLLLVWSWALNRLLAPILPFLMLVLLAGAAELARHRLSDRLRSGLIAVFLLLVSVGAAQGASKLVGAMKDCDRASPFTSRGCNDDETLGLLAAAEYVRVNTEADDVVLAWRPSSVHFVSGRQGESALIVQQFPEGTLADSLRARSIGYVILGTLHKFERGPLARALRASCDGFRLEARFAPSVLLLATRRTGDANVTDACQLLDEYLQANPEFRASEQ